MDIDMAFRIMFTAKATKIFFAAFAFLRLCSGQVFAANLSVFVPGSSFAVDNVRLATASMTSPSVLYLLVAQKEGLNKLAAAGDYVSHYVSSGIFSAQDKLKQSPDKIARFMTGALKGYVFFTARREAPINYMIQFLKSKDRDAVSAIYDVSVKVMTCDGMAEEKILEAVVDEAQREAGVKKNFGWRSFSTSTFCGRRESN